MIRDMANVLFDRQSSLEAILSNKSLYLDVVEKEAGLVFLCLVRNGIVKDVARCIAKLHFQNWNIMDDYVCGEKRLRGMLDEVFN